MPNRDSFVLQFHITSRCGKNCLHCYMKGKEYQGANVQRDIDAKAATIILDGFDLCFPRRNFIRRINLTGGDPLLNPFFWEILKKVSLLDSTIAIIGNPETLTKQLVVRLKQQGVKYFQMSIDGLQNVHDYYRGSGSFEATLSAIKLLRSAGIFPEILMTLSSRNLHDAPKVAKTVAKYGASFFDFVRMVPQGEARSLKDDTNISPNQFREVLNNLHHAYTLLSRKYQKISFGHRDPLWLLYFTEIAGEKVRAWLKTNSPVGCTAGKNLAVVKEDGILMPCRKLFPIGNLLKNSFKELLPNLISAVKKPNNSPDLCHDCELVNFCRGCLAMVYQIMGDAFGIRDPQCWKEVT